MKKIFLLIVAFVAIESYIIYDLFYPTRNKKDTFQEFVSLDNRFKDDILISSDHLPIKILNRMYRDIGRIEIAKIGIIRDIENNDNKVSKESRIKLELYMKDIRDDKRIISQYT